MRFLVIDDDLTTRLLMQKLLHNYGLVDSVIDGEEGVAAFISAHKEGAPYDLITLDILMPNVNGQEALQEIREIEKERNIPPEKQVPVIMVSGLEDSKELHDAFFLGEATSFIVKPIQKDILLEEIKKLGISLE